MKVKCINNSGSAEDYLVVGQIYEAEEKSNSDYKLSGVSSSWMKSRFEIVPDDPQPSIQAQPATTPTGDVDEDRLWQLMRPRLETGHCPCGIHKDQCKYHK